MTTERPTSHAAEGDNAFVDRLRALGLARKAPVAPATKTASSAAPSAPAGDAGALARRLAAIPGATRAAAEPTPEDTPYGQMVEVPAPAGSSTRSAPLGPAVRHFRILAPKMQTRAMGTVTRRTPTA